MNKARRNKRRKMRTTLRSRTMREQKFDAATKRIREYRDTFAALASS